MKHMNVKQSSIVSALFLRFLKERHLLAKFINNYNKFSTNRKNGMTLMDFIKYRCDTKTQYYIIHGAFVFTDTEEGHDFWYEQSEEWKKILKNNDNS